MDMEPTGVVHKDAEIVIEDPNNVYQLVKGFFMIIEYGCFEFYSRIGRPCPLRR